jgi:predicted nicotinamide N-methyase
VQLAHCRCENPNQEVHHVHLEFSRDGQETVNVRVREISFRDGGLGCRVFPSAILMCDWMLDMKDFFDSKHVLELGSGVGTCGIMAAHLGCKKVVLSDFYVSLLSYLLMSTHDICEDSYKQSISVRRLDWHDDYTLWRSSSEQSNEIRQLLPFLVSSHEISESHERKHQLTAMSTCNTENFPNLDHDETFDIIIASDVIYENIQADLLLGVLSRRLRKAGLCFIIAPVRDLTIIQRLIKLLVIADMSVNLCSIEHGMLNRDWWRPTSFHVPTVCRSKMKCLSELLDFTACLVSGNKSTAAVFLCIEKS